MIVLRGRPKRIEQLVFSPDGTVLAALCNTGALQVWRGPPFGGLPEAHPEPGYVSELQFALSGRQMFLGGGSPRVYDHVRRTVTPVPSWAGHGFFAIQPDGERFVMTANNSGSLATPPTFRMTCRPTAAPTHDAAIWTADAAGGVWSRPVFLSDGSRFVQVEADRITNYQWRRHRIVLRSAAAGDVCDETPPLADDILPYGLTARPHGRWLATLRATRIPVFDLADLSRPAVELRNDGRRQFTALAFHP